MTRAELLALIAVVVLTAVIALAPTIDYMLTATRALGGIN